MGEARPLFTGLFLDYKCDTYRVALPASLREQLTRRRVTSEEEFRLYVGGLFQDDLSFNCIAIADDVSFKYFFDKATYSRYFFDTAMGAPPNFRVSFPLELRENCRRRGWTLENNLFLVGMGDIIGVYNMSDLDSYRSKAGL